MSSSFKNQTTINKENKMKKVILAIISVAIVFTAIQPSQAQDQKVLAIIDTAIDSKKLPSVIYEACFTQNRSCPNGQNFMEGSGSASAVVWAKSINDGIYHGDSMVKAALAVDPNIKIVFVRFTNVTATGGSALGNRPESLVSAIDWVSKNAEKYSIDAVSISQSAVDSTNLARCSSDQVTINAISSLTQKNIPAFAATGNNARTDVVGFPACINHVVGVGALFSTSTFEKATNRGPGLDVVAMGKIAITKYNGSPFDLAGSSGATAVSASSYVSKNTYKTFQEYLNSLPKLNISGVLHSYISR
jgi:hypothetical protein